MINDDEEERPLNTMKTKNNQKDFSDINEDASKGNAEVKQM